MSFVYFIIIDDHCFENCVVITQSIMAGRKE